jgi:hypothetical protein
MSNQEVKQKILDWFKSQKKSRFYIKDVEKGLSDIPKSEVKKAVKEMIDEKTLEYWSSGSTTYLMLPGAKKDE